MNIFSAKIYEDVDKQLEGFRLKHTELEDRQVQQALAHETAHKNLQSELLWRIKDAEELLKSRVPEVKVVKMIDELKLVLANQVTISTDKNKNFIEESVKEVYKTITKLSEGTETSLDDLRLIVRAQEKKINYDLATRDQIKALEMQDS